MKRILALFLTATLARTGYGLQATGYGPQAPDRNSRPHAKINLPLLFEENRGQSDLSVRFLARGAGYGLFLTPTDAVFSLKSPRQAAPRVLRMRLLEANAHGRVEGLGVASTRTHYVGTAAVQGPKQIVTNYSKVRLPEVYPGIDLVYYGNQRRLEYDFVVDPGSDPSAIRLSFEGTDGIEIDNSGNLLLRIGGEKILQNAPYVYQEIEGRRADIQSRYVIREGVVSFDVGSYDRTRRLVIDPVLVYATYLGGSGDERIFGMTVDAGGNMYVTGETASPNYPLAQAIRSTNSGKTDVFVTKINSAGTAVVYSTYLGGSDDDHAHAIAVDSAGRATVTGHTSSTNFPTAAPIQGQARGGQDAFVLRLSPGGDRLEYSTYLGGTDDDRAIGLTVDAAGETFVVGVTKSANFPTVQGFQSAYRGGLDDAFLVRINAAGSALTYSTFLGGRGHDIAYAVGLDGEGNIYVTGATGSVDFPTQEPLQGTVQSGFTDVFLTKFNPAGSGLIFSTYIGGSGDDTAVRMAVDASGKVFLTGATDSLDFPVFRAFQEVGLGSLDAFIIGINTVSREPLFSTYLGGLATDGGVGIGLDGAGNIYVAGSSNSFDLFSANAFQTFNNGGLDFFITKIAPSGAERIFSTFLGGASGDGTLNMAVDPAGMIYVAGYTASSDMPTANALFPANAGGTDGFIFKLDASDVTTAADYRVNPYSVVTRSTTGGFNSTFFGNVRLNPSAGHLNPAGVHVMTYDLNGAIASEFAYPAVGIVERGRIYAEISSSVQTGVSFLNPYDGDVTLSFTFTDAEGVDTSSGEATLLPGEQLAAALSQAPFSGGATFSGSFTFTASSPIPALAFRAFVSERQEQFLNQLPIVDPSAAPSGRMVIPQFAHGLGWSTEVLLVNPTEETLNGSFGFYDEGTAAEAGKPATVIINDESKSRFAYSVPPKTSRRFLTVSPIATEETPVEEVFTTGSIIIEPDEGMHAPSAVAIVSFKLLGTVNLEAAVPAMPGTSSGRYLAELSGDFGAAEVNAFRTALTFANPGAAAVPLTLRVRNADGSLHAAIGRLTVPANGKVSRFLPEIPGFESLPASLRGTVEFSTANGAPLASMAFRGRYNSRNEFILTPTPPIEAVEGAAFFPYLAEGRGYSSQFFLFGRPGGAAVTGMLGFFTPTAEPFYLTTR